MYLMIKYIKSVLWRVAKCLSYTEEARCLKVNTIPARLQFAQHSIYDIEERVYFFKTHFNFTLPPTPLSFL